MDDGMNERRMPVARINGREYRMDDRLMQLRSVCNPEDVIDIEPPEIEPWRTD